MRRNYLPDTTVCRFKIIPFIEEGDVFIPNREELEPLFERLASDGYTQSEGVKQALYALQFTPKEMEDYVMHQKALQPYEDWKIQFKNYVLNQQFAPSLSEDDRYAMDEQKQAKKKSKEIEILNRNNPFADVEINEQSYLYPTPNGFEVLSFTSQKQFVRKEYDEGNYYALIPGFKVFKQKERQVANNIIATDSMSTKIKETEGEKQIIYVN